MARRDISTKPTLAPQLIKAQEAADLLNVDIRTIHQWIAKERIPYIELPSGGAKPSYRIPLQGLLNSLSGNYDLAADVESLYRATDR
jgi:excisionase family DNA binding protein